MCFKVIFEASHCIIEVTTFRQFILKKYDAHDDAFSSMHDQSWLWHRSLGHADMDLIFQVNKNELVRGFPKINFQTTKFVMHVK